ncbi:putative DNA helicase transcription factor B3-Domain family [Helianthus debilis subsp. tardiflorus]
MVKCFYGSWNGRERFYFFEVVADNTIDIYHFKTDRDLDVKDKFYHIMMFPEAKNLWLPKKFMEHNFNDDLLENVVTIRYSPTQERTVRIKKLWNIHYYILDFSQISTDLSLVKWDFLVFHRVETYTFNLIVFRLHDDGSLVAEMGIPVPQQQPIPEPEYEAENDIEDGIQHGVAEDQFPLEDVNVDNQVSDDEDLPVHGNPPLPVNDVYEIEWVLTYRFRFPQHFVENVPLDDVQAMNVQTMNGVSLVLEMCSERARRGPRLKIVAGNLDKRVKRLAEFTLYPLLLVHDSFRDACYALGLLDADTEYIEAIKEANETTTCSYIRVLFAMMLLSNTLSRPEVIWESTWKYMTDDFIYRLRKFHRSEALSVPEDHLKNYALGEIENFLLRNNSSLGRFLTMPYPDEASLANSQNRLIYEERCDTQLDRGNEYERQMSMLNDEQRSVFEEILKVVDGDAGGVFFVYGYGGTGKTFLWKTLSATIRSKGQIVLNVASSGIASLLPTGGRTAHSRFHIPLNLTEDSVCHIKPDSDTARLLRETKLIIWDEAPMVHKHAFEALDKTMNDIFNMDTSIGSEISFGGKVIVFGGDFRQILPVVPNGGRQEIVNASLCSSYLWSKCKLLRLTKNMGLTIGRSTSEIEDINNFAKWLLDLGEGNVGCPNDSEASIEIPPDLLINDTSDPISSLIDFVYPSILDNYNNHNYFSERAILAPKNEVVHEINDRLLALFPGEEREYLSSGSLCQTENPNSTQLKLYSPDVLNGLKVSGLPNHRLVLKVGVPVMLLRNIDQQNGLCNGTRLQIKRLYNRVIEAEIISGGNIGTRTYIPRLNLIPSDKKVPFAFQRRQFPIAVCFAMTINKSQGQSLSRVGLYLR